MHDKRIHTQSAQGRQGHVSQSVRRSRGETIRLIRDIALIGVSILIAINLAESGVVESSALTLAHVLARVAGEISVLTVLGYASAAFIAGIFFTSAFTIAPAAVVLAALSSHSSIWLIASAGALGATLGDLIIFFFIRDVFAADLMSVLHRLRLIRHTAWVRGHFIRLMSPIIGALIIASPLPDELGLALMGFSKMKTKGLIPIAIVMNFAGILLIAFFGRII